MSTPTPSHPHHPNSATKKAPGHVSTPSHLNFSSPAPRSVPSPTATRKEHPGKTPVNHPTTSSQGSKTFGSTPMVHSLSQTGNTIGVSPGANTMSFGTPNGLGLEGLTPGQMNLATPAGMAGLGMGISMADLGLAPLPKKRNEDEERRAKMRKILKSIGKPTGRVSEDSIARIGRRVGFANDIDVFTPSERERGVGNRVISTAGTKILVEIDLKDHIPRGVQVTFDSENEALLEQSQAAGKVLLEDLRVADNVALTAKLDRFAVNLERLAKIDRLCSNQVNCFEALSGIYTSLHRLHEQEGLVNGKYDVMRKGSGWPRAHARGRLGTTIEYWQEAPQAMSNEHAKGDMEIDEPSKNTTEDGVYRLRIGVEPSPAGLYPSVCVSDAWLPDPLNLPDTTQTLPWQNPPQTLISNTEHDGMVIDNNPKLPDLRFSLELDPPIIMPWSVASAVYQSVGMVPPQTLVQQAWHSLLLDPASTAPFDAATDSADIAAERTVLVCRDGKEADVTHAYTVEVVKPDSAHKLEKLPFSHPQQLVEMLPTLRQWACFSSLVRAITPNMAAMATNNSAVKDGVLNSDGMTKPQVSISLSDLLTPPATPDPFADKLSVHISLITSPAPTLALSFPSATNKDATCSVTVRVLLNAELVVTGSESVAHAGSYSVMDGVKDMDSKKLAKALEVCGDLGLWIEWLRSRA